MKIRKKKNKQKMSKLDRKHNDDMLAILMNKKNYVKKEKEKKERMVNEIVIERK